MISLNTKENLKAIIAFIFVISGSAGLIYQIVWFKYISLFLGNSTYAQMAVLSTFLGGLAIGNHFFGKSVEKFSNPVKYYGILEIAVGIYCLAYPLLNSFAGNLFISISAANQINPESFLFNVLRFLLSAALLLFPTIAMGGTLPVLSQFFIERIETARRDTAILYYLNSFGAVMGVFLGGFYLIKALGLETTIYFTAVINITAGASAFFLSKKVVLEETQIEQSTTNNEAGQNSNIGNISKSTTVVVILIAGISGTAALLYEMVWTRLLINFFGSSTYAFSIMLMSFIGGITIGGWIISKKFLARFDRINTLSLLQFLIAFFTFVVLTFYEKLPYYLWKISYLFSKTNEAFPLFLSAEFCISFLTMLLPAIFMGMSLPLAVEIVSSVTGKTGYTVGKVFSVNTFGNVIGVILSGAILIPLFGIRGTFLFGIGINLFAAILLIVKYEKIVSTKKFYYGGTAVISFAVFFIFFGSLDPYIMTSGVFRKFKEPPPESYEEFVNMYKSEKIVYYREGSAATVAVSEWIDDPSKKRLIINGKPDASSYFDMPTQVLLGQIPMMLHPDPKNVFVVGLGTGTTVGSVLTHPVNEVVCAEISKGVIEASNYFKKENLDCLNDSRLKLFNEDAVTLLKIRKENFDVIISEPSNPWVAGIGNLFSKEYFTRCYNKLNKNGIMVQWFHLYEANDEIVKLVLNTFYSVFQNAQIWTSVSNDIILVGAKDEIKFNDSLFVKRFYEPKIKEDFERINISSPFTFLCNQLAAQKNFYEMTVSHPINSEIHPLLEFMAPEAMYVSKQSTFIYPFDEKYDTLSGGIYVKDFIKNYPPSKSALLNAAEYTLDITRNTRFAYGLTRFLIDQYPEDYSINLLYSKAFEFTGIYNARDTYFQKLIKLYPDSTQIRKDYNNSLLQQNINSTSFLKTYSIKNIAENFLQTAEKDSLSQVKLYEQIAYAYLDNREIDSAYSMCKKVSQMLSTNSTLARKLDLSDYYYTASVAALYNDDSEMLFANYFNLINTNSNYKYLFRLRRLISWYTKNNTKANIN